MDDRSQKLSKVDYSFFLLHFQHLPLSQVPSINFFRCSGLSHYYKKCHYSTLYLLLSTTPLPSSSQQNVLKELSTLSLPMVHLPFNPQPSASCQCHHTPKRLSPRAPIISMHLNLTHVFSSCLDTCRTHCWLSTHILFLHYSFTAKLQFYSGF